MSFDLTLSVDRYSEHLDDHAGMLEQVIAEKLNDLTHRLYGLIDANLSGKVLQEKTGQLANSVMEQAAAWVGTVCQSSVGIPSDSPAFKYGIVHEMGGLGYYDIFPKEALALAFESGGGSGDAAPWGGQFGLGDGVVFAGHVNHPPAKKQPFIAPAVEELRESFYAELSEAIGSVLGG